MQGGRGPFFRYPRGLSLAVVLFACSRGPEPARSVAAAPPRSAAPSGMPVPPPSALSPATITAELSPALPPAFAPGASATPSHGGIVVAVEPLAAEAGARVLERGGNAVDAAIATALALCVTHPNAASLGGGGFALVRPKGLATVAIDFREVAPRALTRPRFDRMIAAGARGPAAVGVPGTVAGLALLHERFGSVPFDTLVAQATTLARDGHAIRPWQAKVLAWNYAGLAPDPAMRRIFGRGRAPLAAGARLVQTELAATLDRLARFGPDDFYRGETAQVLARALSPEGPALEDFASYRAVERTPLRFEYRGYTLETMPPPSAGGVALAGVLLALRKTEGDTPLALGSAQAIHTFIEASRRAQAERRLGVVDPDTLSERALAERKQRWLDPAFWLDVPIAPEQATPSERIRSLYDLGLRETEHTTHLSVADARGMVVSLTTTLSASFGAKLVAGSTGIVMNNAVASFGSVGPNQPAPGKRTVSSMAPTLLLRGEEVSAVLGTPGGDTIPSTLAQLVRNLVDYRLPLDRAILAPRWHHGFVPDVARYEPVPKPDPALLDALRARGHALRPLRRPIGDANCIVIDGERAWGFADPREFGVAVAPAAE